METFQKLTFEVTHCNRCPRLRAYCNQVAQTKKREFRHWIYWGKPVPGFGDPKARLWIVGLAPAAHGANRTGRMFTGDSSGNWLYQALFDAGFANQPTSVSSEDGLKLKGAYISAAGRCAPPDNKPLPEELSHCATFLDEEFRLLKERRLILALGSIAFNAVLKLLQRQAMALPSPKPAFGHGVLHTMGSERVLCSYHPSRQNTNTGRLTRKMWAEIFEKSAQAVRD